MNRKDHKGRFLSVLFINMIFLVTGFSSTVDAKVYIDIDTPCFRPLPQALVIIDSAKGPDAEAGTDT